jgi:uncharacterized membrane protein
MAHSTKTMKAAVAGVLAIGLGAASAALAGAPPKPTWKGHEKCAGVTASGMNDCGTSAHDCAGKSTVEKSPDEWMWVPAGTCKKMAGGQVMAMGDKKMK